MTSEELMDTSSKIFNEFLGKILLKPIRKYSNFLNHTLRQGYHSLSLVNQFRNFESQSNKSIHFYLPDCDKNGCLLISNNSLPHLLHLYRPK